jgi:DNA-binding LytR/AlgR family response regulator
MKISSIIIDDEPLARKGLKEYIADVDFLRLEAEFDNALKATELLNKGTIQLVFLDIQMPKITGIDFFRSLKKPPPVIFTTAYPQYAIDGFELNALDYLVKPVSFDRFLKSAMKAREYYEVREKNTSAANTVMPGYFFIKADNKLIRIQFDEMLFAEAMQNYVVIHTRDKKYITYLTFKSVEEYLPADRFIKTHKSYLVSAEKIDSIEGNNIRMGSNDIPISRNMKDEVMEKLLKGKFLKR